MKLKNDISALWDEVNRDVSGIKLAAVSAGALRGYGDIKIKIDADVPDDAFFIVGVDASGKMFCKRVEVGP